MPQGCWLASFGKNHYRNELKSVRVSQIIWVNICWVKILNYRLHDCIILSPNAATMPFPKTNVSTINPNLKASQHSLSCMNMTDVIIKWTKHVEETQNLTKKLQISTHPSTHQCARNIPNDYANVCTTVLPVHSILTMSNLQLRSSLYGSYWPQSLRQED